MKPFALVILLAVFVYTLLKKDFGQVTHQSVSERQQRIRMWGMGACIGFYDGFFGPGTGSFLVLGFIALISFDFLKASAHAKLVNAATNLASVLFFVKEGTILYAVAIPMAVANLSGAFFGARLALLKGNQFIRFFFPAHHIGDHYPIWLGFNRLKRPLNNKLAVIKSASQVGQDIFESDLQTQTFRCNLALIKLNLNKVNTPVP